jgi:hypothetical protein
MKEHKSFIFVHIPKCAGSSFRELVYRNGLASGIPEDEMHIPGAGSLPFDKNVAQLQRAELKALRKKKLTILADHSKYDVHREAKLRMDQPFYYILFRDPVERFISHYNFFYRQLGRDGYLGKDLNDLDDKSLAFFLGKLANVQLVFLLNGPAFRYDHLSFSGKCFHHVKKTLRLLSGGRLFLNPNSVGVKAEPFWLEYAEELLVNHYGAFGLVEKLDASLRLLADSPTGQLRFTGLSLPIKNKTQIEQRKQDIEDRIIEKIIAHNHYDVQLYEKASQLLDAKISSLQ